ncbi:DUF3078 domain-containing protein, partial [Odoribacter sp. OttesenSCG-928-L07]|nr:DUF3078 domain-containing protein [Odoribacter sp. OttesenSCG-928-L07]
MLKSKTIIVIIILFLSKVAFGNKNIDNITFLMQDSIIASDSTKKVSPWKHSFNAGVTFNQYSYTNWAAGGNNSIAGTALLDYKLSCEKEVLTFTNAISLGYGQMLLAGVDAPLRKTEDKINFYSQLNYKLNKRLSYSLLLDFKSQFYNGYTYPNDSVYISTFFAPAYLTISWGLQFVPVKPLSLFLSPLSGKFTFVLDDKLANNGSFGVTPAVYDEFGAIITPGKKIRPEIGFNFVFKYSQTLAKKIDVTTKLEFHNNYLDERESNRWNFDIDWEGKIIFSITKFFSTNFFWRLVYDDDIKFPIYEEV